MTPWKLRERLLGPWPQGPSLWLHGASLGESRMLLGVLECLRREGFQTGAVLLTVQKAEILEFLRSISPPGCTVALAPADLPGTRSLFFRTARPWALVLGENELWPGWLRMARAHGIPVALVSGRVRRAFPGRGLLSCACMQTQADLRCLEGSGLVGEEAPVCVGGDWKSLPWAMGDVEIVATRRPVDWLLASLHQEEWGVAALLARQALAEGLCLVLAPRRLDELPFFEAHIRMLDQEPLCWPDRAPGHISLVREFGRMGELVRASRRVLMGGSFCPVGVHDFWEPLRAACEVYIGPRRSSHEEVLSDLLARGLVGAMDGAGRVLSAPGGDRAKLMAYMECMRESLRASFALFARWLARAQVARFVP